MPSQYNGGGYGDHTPLGLPIDQQHSAQQPGATPADLTPTPAPATPTQESK